MSIKPCEQCGSRVHVIEFTHFDPEKTEWLCWDCREPIIMERIHEKNDSEHVEDYEDEDEQKGITDYI